MMTFNVHAFAGVIVGALLASLGGFISAQLNDWLQRRRRSRSASLLFGETLATIEVLMRLVAREPIADQVDLFLTRGFLRAVQRETETYFRNRELLPEIRNQRIRAQLHGLMVRISLALESMMRSQAAMGSNQSIDKRAVLRGDLDFLMAQSEDLGELLHSISAYAHVTFNAHIELAARVSVGHPSGF